METYKNVMELLVEEEVKRQLKALPAQVASYINSVELVAYALNQLPALYATSQKGLDYQIQRGQMKLGVQITQAVQRAIAAVRRAPLRTCIPLQPQHQSAPLRHILHQLRVLLKNDKIDWETLPTAVAEALAQPDSIEMAWKTQYKAGASLSRTKLNRLPDTPFSAEMDSVRRRKSGNTKSTVPPMQEHSSNRESGRLESGWDDPFRKI